MGEDREKNKFIEALKKYSSESSNSEFPRDEFVSKNFEKLFKHYRTKMTDIDRKIKIGKTTKNGEQYFLYRKKIEISKPVSTSCTLSSYYFIINSDGNIIGKISVYSNDEPNYLEMAYDIIPEYMEIGIGTVMLEELIKEIFERKVFDNISYICSGCPDISKTSIKKIRLAINNDNIPSKKVAEKNGFKDVSKNLNWIGRDYELTIEDYLKQKEKEK